jgi:hypothetical protein
MQTIGAILEASDIGDVLSNGLAQWKVVSKYQEQEREDEVLVVIARPLATEPHSEYDYELWNVGAEKHAIMPDLKRVV